MNMTAPGTMAAPGRTPAQPVALPGPCAATPPLHDARALTGGGSTAHVLLDGQVYTLRITRADKLILTK